MVMKLVYTVFGEILISMHICGKVSHFCHSSIIIIIMELCVHNLHASYTTLCINAGASQSQTRFGSLNCESLNLNNDKF